MKEVIRYVSAATSEPMPAEKMYYSDEELGKLINRTKRQVADLRVIMEGDPVASDYILDVSGKVTRYDAFVSFSVHYKKNKHLLKSRTGMPDFDDKELSK